MPRFAIERVRTQTHRHIVDAPSHEAAEAFADQDFDTDDFETVDADRRIVEIPVQSHVTADYAIELCGHCGAVKPFDQSCGCQ